MTIDEISRATSNGAVLSISRSDLETMLEMSDDIRERATGLAGHIRRFRSGNVVFVQERNPEGTLFLRRFRSEEAAVAFVEARLAAYERMWDG